MQLGNVSGEIITRTHDQTIDAFTARIRLAKDLSAKAIGEVHQATMQEWLGIHHPELNAAQRDFVLQRRLPDALFRAKGEPFATLRIEKTNQELRAVHYGPVSAFTFPIHELPIEELAQIQNRFINTATRSRRLIPYAGTIEYQVNIQPAGIITSELTGDYSHTTFFGLASTQSDPRRVTPTEASAFQVHNITWTPETQAAFGRIGLNRQIARQHLTFSLLHPVSGGLMSGGQRS